MTQTQEFTEKTNPSIICVWDGFTEETNPNITSVYTDTHIHINIFKWHVYTLVVLQISQSQDLIILWKHQ